MPYVHFGLVVLRWLAFENASLKGFENSKEKEKGFSLDGGKKWEGQLLAQVLKPTGLSPSRTGATDPAGPLLSLTEKRKTKWGVLPPTGLEPTTPREIHWLNATALLLCARQVTGVKQQILSPVL